MRFGVCYYPEQCSEDVWASDSQAMVDLGLELVRVGEFAWSSYEPSRDQWDFGWLDRAVETLANAGLDVILGTPTATPPVWLSLERPDILSVGPDGRRRAYGSRRHTCPTSAAYREEAARIVTELLSRYGDHEAIVAWQVDNEPGNHDSARCWCEECETAFSGWLASRFESIDDLNEAWGTAFWSQTYPDFEAVRLPVPTMTGHNPALEMAHRRFANHQMVEAMALQFRLIEDAAPGRDITSNLYFGDEVVDPRDLARLGGVASFDVYPHGTSGWVETGFLIDLHVGSSPQRRGWIMEQQAGPINWTEMNPPVPPGQVRTWLWAAAIRGVEAVLFFRWRAARFGQEQYHSGLVHHDGSPTPLLEELRLSIQELGGGAPHGERTATTALLWSLDDSWAIELDPHRAGLQHRDLVLAAYGAAMTLGLDVDVVDEQTDLSHYELVLVPSYHHLTAPRLASLNSALDAGVTVLVGPRSLVKDEHEAWSAEPLPAGLASRLGMRVAQSLSQVASVTLEPGGHSAGVWTDVLELTNASTEVHRRYSGGGLDEVPALVNRGSLWYLGASSQEAWRDAVSLITGTAELPPHVERVRRGAGEITIDHGALTATTTDA